MEAAGDTDELVTMAIALDVGLMVEVETGLESEIEMLAVIVDTVVFA